MSTITRRRFLASSTFAAGAAALAGPVALADLPDPLGPQVKSGTDIVTLGNTGMKTSVLGLGTGTVGGREQRELGEQGFVRLAREAYDRGVRYIDTADMYRIHPFVAAALRELPREEIFLQTKTRAKDAETAKADIERFRRELGVETIDSLLMHCMQKEGWPTDMRPVIDVLLEAKQQGRVRAIGVSCHTFEALMNAVDCDFLDVHLVRINAFGTRMDETPEQVAHQIRRMHEKKRGVIGMKVYGEGDFKTRKQRRKSLKYVLHLGTVQAFTIGFRNVQQIDETLQMIADVTAERA